MLRNTIIKTPILGGVLKTINELKITNFLVLITCQNSVDTLNPAEIPAVLININFKVRVL